MQGYEQGYDGDFFNTGGVQGYGQQTQAGYQARRGPVAARH